MGPAKLALTCTFGIALWSHVCSAQPEGKQQQAPLGPAVFNQVLNWLPTDTETVIGASNPSLTEVEAQVAADSNKLSDRGSEQQMEVLPLSLFQFKNGGLLGAIKNRKVILAVEGSRHFRPPAVLGTMRYEGCAIVMFADSNASVGNAFMKTAASLAKRVDTIGGRAVAVFEEESENDIWTTFVAFPRGDSVVVATDADYLRTVFTRMTGLVGARALPETLQEWKYVDTRSRVWGIRHYDKTQAELDPTSPFQGPAPANFPDSAAVGLAFSLSRGGSRVITVTYLSGIKDGSEVFRRWFPVTDPPPGIKIGLRSAGPNAVECSLSVTDPEINLGVLSVLSQMLGHAVYF